MKETLLREHITSLLSGRNAHLDWKGAFSGISPKLRGVRPSGMPHSLWELLEHLRIAQWDILEFSRDAKHVSPEWPAGCWPEAPEPPSAKAWEKSLKLFARDLALSSDPDQQFLYVGGGTGVFIVDRKTLEIVGTIQPAGIIGPGHEIATDSKGNLYIAQTTAGLQKLTFKGMSNKN